MLCMITQLSTISLSTGRKSEDRRYDLWWESYSVLLWIWLFEYQIEIHRWLQDQCKFQISIHTIPTFFKHLISHGKSLWTTATHRCQPLACWWIKVKRETLARIILFIIQKQIAVMCLLESSGGTAMAKFGQLGQTLSDLELSSTERHFSRWWWVCVNSITVSSVLSTLNLSPHNYLSPTHIKIW